jgi:hypothetical protein
LQAGAPEVGGQEWRRVGGTPRTQEARQLGEASRDLRGNLLLGKRVAARLDVLQDGGERGRRTQPGSIVVGGLVPYFGSLERPRQKHERERRGSTTDGLPQSR